MYWNGCGWPVINITVVHITVVHMLSAHMATLHSVSMFWLHFTVKKKFHAQKKFYSVWKNMESPTMREQRLQRRREREQARWAAETAAEKEERLRKQNEGEELWRQKNKEGQDYRENVLGRAKDFFYTRTSCYWPQWPPRFHNNNRYKSSQILG